MPFELVVKNPDHVTVVVTNLTESQNFFGLLGFELKISERISGDKMSEYLAIKDMEADHLTMVLKESEPRFEIQLLHFRKPKINSDPEIINLARPGYNHLCFRVDNIELSINHLRKNGVRIRSPILEYLNRKLVYIEGPEFITVELSEWL
ncbi:VOC family protein [uncultured Microbulbifer sp.]|uniref:VOC family protein n=1 Tax=uncultured Microbulbifer sp. TaxID=348147 RepID=UPI0026204614|nr:VOC family protein [uncultured Microbulbifer sp.]